MSLSGVALRTGEDYTPWRAALSASWMRPEPTMVWAERMYDQGTLPFVHLMVDDTMENIANGVHDTALRAWIDAVKAYQDSGRHCVLVPYPEFNGNWTPYGQEEPLDHGLFIRAYRNIVQMGRDAGLSKEHVLWCWAPNNWGFPSDSLEAWWPGADVDVIGGSIYNWGGIVDGAAWVSATDLMDEFVSEVDEFAGDQPIIATQTGSGLGDDRTPAWLSELANYTDIYTNIQGFIWFSISEFEYEPGVHDFNDRVEDLSTDRPLHWFQEEAMPHYPLAVAGPPATTYGTLPDHGYSNVALVLHTTETAGMPGFRDGDVAPHYVYAPQTREWTRLAEYEDGYVGTLKGHTTGGHGNCKAFQVEIIGYSNSSYSPWVGDFTTENYQDLADFVRWARDRYGIEDAVVPEPLGGWLYGVNSPYRLTDQEWADFSGLTAHGGVPRNTHWDTGVLNLELIHDLAVGTEPPVEPPDPGDDVDYRTVKNVPDANWARTVVDGMLCQKVINEGDGSDWEKPLKNGTIWNYLYRYTDWIESGRDC